MGTSKKLGNCFTFAFFVGILVAVGSSNKTRSFRVDFKNNQFLKDGKPFVLVSGSLHYFRVPAEYWKDRMQKMRLAGLNAVQTYVEWSGHQPEKGQLNFDGSYDIRLFMETAKEVGLLVVLCPGPYIGGDRENGGLPYWLRRLDPDMRVRTSDKQFMEAVKDWFDNLLLIMQPYLYENGGPIVMVQLENDYGHYSACDTLYMRRLAGLARYHFEEDVILFRTNYPAHDHYRCDNLDGTLMAANLGIRDNVRQAFSVLRRTMERGPIFVAQYWSGWFDHWGRPHSKLDEKKLLDNLEEILRYNASVNFYMFHGGTNFAFTNGASPGPVTTSYDYAAPLTEAGDPTDLYFKIREVVGRYLPIPDAPLPAAAAKLGLGTVRMEWFTPLDAMLAFFRDRKDVVPVTSEHLKSFEELGQAYGYVMYSTTVQFRPRSPAKLAVPGIRNRGYVMTAVTRAVLGAHPLTHTVQVIVQEGETLFILVENTGRRNDAHLTDNVKGILGDVTLDGEVLKNWTMQALPLTKTDVVGALVYGFTHSSSPHCSNQDCSVPGAYFGNFVLPEGQAALDTFLDPTGWGKGVAYVNNFNLGRYWPSIGPQVTLYVPGVLLRPYPQKNTIFLFETEKAPPCSKRTVSFVDAPIIDGPVPHRDSR
ncbi:beta-galactosidase-like [Haemaphysalis longicornis]